MTSFTDHTRPRRHASAPLRRARCAALGAIVLLALSCAERTSAQSTSLERVTVTRGAEVEIQLALDTVVREQLPPEMFGFNINVVHLQTSLWDPGKSDLKPPVGELMQAFPGALYRYPGGLLGNVFNWQWSVGEPSRRRAQKLADWIEPTRVEFGLLEYLSMVRRLGGRDWYVLNLVGWDETRLPHELPIEEVVESNVALARFMRENGGGSGPRYYQLGNELDRSIYQWTHEKYVERSRAVMQGIREVDPDARFVVFLRDFDWRYRGKEKSRGRSKALDLARDVMGGLPEVDDVTLLLYYDGLPDAKPHVYLGTRLKQTLGVIEKIKALRPGRPVRVWFTEHAANWDRKGPGGRANWRQTSSMSGAISSADFLIAMAQVPDVSGAAWHAFNGGPWHLFDTSEPSRPAPRPVYWMFRVLRSMSLPQVVDTRVTSPNSSGYGGGYDVRAAGFKSPEDGRIGLWVVNRSPTPHDLSIRSTGQRHQRFSVEHTFISGPGVFDPVNETAPTVVLEPEGRDLKWPRDGVSSLTVPGYSVSSIVLVPKK